MSAGGDRGVDRRERDTDLVCAAGRQDELGVRVEGEAIDLCRVGVHGVGGLIGGAGPGVPDHQFLIVGHGAEQTLVEQMPGDVLWRKTRR